MIKSDRDNMVNLVRDNNLLNMKGSKHPNPLINAKKERQLQRHAQILKMLMGGCGVKNNIWKPNKIQMSKNICRIFMLDDQCTFKPDPPAVIPKEYDY